MPQLIGNVSRPGKFLIFVDESIQQNHGYICVAFVYSENDLSSGIQTCLTNAGLVPGVDEYKSGALMHGKPELHRLRAELFGIIQMETQVGLLLVPVVQRGNLGVHIVDTVGAIINANGLSSQQSIFIDEGISVPDGEGLASLVKGGAEVNVGCNSVEVMGIQLADHAAYHCSYLLKEKIEGPNKLVRIGEESGFDEHDAELGWVIRTQLRYTFFKESKPWRDEDGDWNFMCQLRGYGAFIAKGLPEPVASAASEVFEHVWIGCIH